MTRRDSGTETSGTMTILVFIPYAISPNANRAGIMGVIRGDSNQIVRFKAALFACGETVSGNMYGDQGGFDSLYAADSLIVQLLDSF